MLYCYNGTDHCHCVSGEEQCSGKLWIWIPATGSQDHQGHRCCLICDADNITQFWQRWPEGGATLGCQLSLQWSTTVLYRSKELSLSLISRIYVNKIFYCHLSNLFVMVICPEERFMNKISITISHFHYWKPDDWFRCLKYTWVRAHFCCYDTEMIKQSLIANDLAEQWDAMTMKKMNTSPSH